MGHLGGDVVLGHWDGGGTRCGSGVTVGEGVQQGVSAVLCETAFKRGFPGMLPDVTVPLPAALAGLRSAFAPCFTAPSCRAFCRLACGFLARAGKGLARSWP